MFSIARLFREMRERGLENTFQRYYANYQAEYTRADDPLQIGRGCVKVESLGFGAPHPGYASTFTPYGGEDFGFYFPPYEGDQVYISFDHGDVNAPMVMGSSWATRGQKRTTDSDLPAEFVKTVLAADGTEAGVAPTVRGIKVRKGHGLAFDETDGTSKVEMWTGESRGIGSPAARHHAISLDDTTGEEKVVVTTFGGHKSTWQDKEGSVFVQTLTIGDHEILLDDTNRQILVRTADGHQALFDDAAKKIVVTSTGQSTITIDDNTNSITARTVGGNQFTLDDTLRKIAGLTTGGREFVMDDATQVVRLTSPTPPQSVMMSPATGTTLSDASPSGVQVLATVGPLVATGQGTTMTSAGAAPATVVNTGGSSTTTVGLETKTLLGGSIQAITGLWTLAGGFTANINALFIFLGTGLQLRLVNEQFFASAYNTHFHISGTPGTPTSAPVAGLGIPGTHTTVQTFAS